jgi:hypothetical protein
MQVAMETKLDGIMWLAEMVFLTLASFRAIGKEKFELPWKQG